MGLTVVDAGVIIAVLDASDAHHAKAKLALHEVNERGDQLVLPASAYAEALVAPSRAGDAAVAAVDRLLDDVPITVEPASRAIAAAAAGLRAVHGRALRLPDALVLATAILLKADRVITTDAKWPAAGVAVDVLT